MDQNRMLVFAIGAGFALVLYVAYKVIRSRWGTRRGMRPAPKKRPRQQVAAPRPQAEFDAPPPPVKKPQPAPVVASRAPGDLYDGSDYVYGGMTSVMAEMVPSTEDGRTALTKSLRNAGYYEPHAWENFSAMRYLAMMAPLVLFGVLLVLAPASLEPLLMIGLIVGPILGWALPALYVRGKAANRLREIENGMPDMLDLLNMCVSQGMTVSGALGRVGRELDPVYPALAKELRIVTEQGRVGSLAQGLTNFGSRVDVPEVHSFSSLLIQTERMGTSVSDALAEYSDSMRESLKQRADEKANSATFKLLFPTVICLMPAVFLFLMGPALIELNRFFSSGGIDALNNGAQAQQFNSQN